MKTNEKAIKGWVERSSKDYMSKRYFKSLVDVGFATNTHVYELNCDYLKSRLPRSEAKYLLDMKNFYDSLTPFQGMILINEYLEKGKYYPYWWMKYGDEKFIAEQRRKFKCKLANQILSLANHA